MKTSVETAAISKALAEAQGKLKNPAFDCTNPHFKSKYASLAAIRDAVMGTLSACGLSLTQEVTIHEHGVAVLTTLWHASGQFMASEPLVIPVVKDDPQGVVAASTYGRRVGMSSFLCVVGDDDTDGNDVPKPPSRPVARQEAPSAAPAAEASFIDKVALALQATKDGLGLGNTLKAALERAEKNGSTKDDVERLKPLMDVQYARFAIGDDDFLRMLTLHKGVPGKPWYGLSGDAKNRFSADLAHAVEKGK